MDNELDAHINNSDYLNSTWSIRETRSLENQIIDITIYETKFQKKLKFAFDIFNVRNLVNRNGEPKCMF
jgi:transcription termination factor NusB